MKRIFKLGIPVFSIFILLLAMSTFSTFAESNVAVASTEFDVHQGETFTTTIYIPDGANIVDFDISLTFDTENLTLKSIEENEDAKGTVIFNNSKEGRISINYTRTNKNVTTYLPLIDLTFKVDDNIGVGSYDCLTVDKSSAFIAHRLNDSGKLDVVDFECNFAKLNIYEMGDVDLSGTVDIADATYIRRHLAAFDGSILSDFKLSLADTYYDDVIDIADAICVQRHLADLDGLYSNRVNVTFYDINGDKYATKSVLYDGTLITIPTVPKVEGYSSGLWSLSADEYVKPDYNNMQKDISIYAFYSGKENPAMDYYKKILTNIYYSGDLPTNLNSDLRLQEKLNYEDGCYATLTWSSNCNYVLNSTTGLFTKPTYPQNMKLTAIITSYNSNNKIDSEGSITFDYKVPGMYLTPTKESVEDFLKYYFTDDTDGKYRINYDVKLLSKLNNTVLPVEGPEYDNFEIRLNWFQNVDGELKPISQVKRTTSSQINDYVAVATFNGKPLEDDGKIYIDDVEVTAIDQMEIKNYIINEIASTGSLATNNRELWNNDKVYGTTVTWETGADDIAYVANNVIKLKDDAISGSTLPLNARVSYKVDGGTDEFILAYNMTVSCDNTKIKAPENMDPELYKAIKSELEDNLGYRGDLTSAALANVKFVNLDLSGYPEISSLRGLSYCKNLRTLNISGLHITDSTMNQIATLSYLEAFIARGCDLDNLTDGGTATLRNATGLKLLDLTNNNFTSLDSVFAKGVRYGRLREVYLSDNKLTNIDALSRAPMMTYLSLANNGLTTEGSASIANYKLLTYLSLANNKIDSVEHLKGLKYLRELRLFNNQISNVNDLRRLINLEILYIGHNKIKDIGNLNTLTKLEILYANDNEIFDISALRDLSKLEVINVSNNKLSSLSVLLNYKSTLTEIYAEDNNLTDFSFINGADKLHILMLAGNKVEMAQDNMVSWLSGLSNMEVLTLSDIQLTNLAFLDSMRNLSRLDVANCGLHAFSGEDSNIQFIANRYDKLKVLNISNNDFTDGEEEILKLRNVPLLTVLYADNICNNLDAYTLTYSMTELKYISLENCGITNINWLHKFNSLEYVDLAGNNISQVDFEAQISNASLKTIDELYLDTNVPCSFANAFRVIDFNVKQLSLAGITIGKMEYMPSEMEKIQYLNLDNTGLTNLTGADLELSDLYSLEKYKTLKTVDVSHLETDISLVEKLPEIQTVYAVGTPDSKLFYKNNLRTLQRLYNKGKACYLYDKQTKYEPVAQKEGTEILNLIDDFSCNVTVAADNVISDNNPLLIDKINDFDIAWTVSNSENYEIVDNHLAVKDYTGIGDETLTLTATITVYTDQSPVSRDFTINTHILRVSAQYIETDATGYSPSLTRDSVFSYNVTLKAAETEGFSNPVKPVEDNINYHYAVVSSNGNNIPYPNVISISDNHQFAITPSAALGATLTISIDISHNTKSGEVICDIERIDIPVLIASRTFTVNFVTNGGTLIDNNGLVREQCEYIEDAPIFENLTLSRPGYLFKGWYLDDTFTTLFSENGNDATMPSKNISLYAKWEALSYTINFDANEGELSTTSMTVLSDVEIGEMPVPTRTYYTFDGWFTEKEGGTQVTAETVLARTDNLQLYAHWTLNSFIVSFDPNGGTVKMNELRAYCGESLGELPVPTRDYYTFAGWYTTATDGTRVYGDEKYSVASDFTLYAHWIQNATSGWVRVSDMPSDAQVVSRKWSYTLREYTSNSASSLSGWTKYDTKRTSWGGTQGPVYSNPQNGSRNVWSEQYVSGYNTRHIWHFYKYGYSPTDYSYSVPSGGRTKYDVYLTYYPTTTGQRPVDYSGGTFRWWNGSNWAAVYFENEYDENNPDSPIYSTRWYYQEPIYTYYFYRDVDKEETTDPTGQSNVSNVQELVQYIPKKVSYTNVSEVTYNDHTYTFVSSPYALSWEMAKAYCEQNGGHLATITSSDEQNTVANLGEQNAWIGGYRVSDDSWAWVTDESFDYSNWRQDEPNNTDGNENCIAIYPDHSWNDYSNTTTAVSSFIMEIE